MADDGVEEILRELELSDLIETFEKVLPKLNEQMVNSLIPAIGDRATFLSYWQKTFKSKKNDENSKEETLKRKEREEDENNESNSSKKVCLDISKENNSSILNNATFVDICEFETLKPLKQLLKECDTGRQVLSKYEICKTLEEKDRKKICSAIITEIMNKKKRLVNEVAQKIAHSIVALFPSESAKTYYMPPVKKSEYDKKFGKQSDTNRKSKSIPSKGKLMSMYRNRSSENKRLEKMLVKESGKKDESENESSGDDNQEIQESIDWLAVNEVPWDLVMKHWEKTSNSRQEEFKNLQDKNLANIFKSWKLYEHVQGYELIDIDFKNLKLTNVSLTMDVWNKFFQALKMNVNQRDQTAVNLNQLITEETSSNARVLLNLSLLAHMYPSKSMFKIQGKSIRPSIGLSKDSIFKIADTAGDIQRVKTTAKEKAVAQKLPIQPYIIVIGAVDDVQDTYVCIDEKLYKVNGILHALDVCFKAFHVFNLEYPIASEHLWILIQKGIYKINLKCDPEISSIQHALTKFVHEEK